jgi:hypothetical protein
MDNRHAAVACFAMNHDVALAGVVMMPIAVTVADANTNAVHSDANVHIIRLRRDRNRNTGRREKSNCKCPHLVAPFLPPITTETGSCLFLGRGGII